MKPMVPSLGNVAASWKEEGSCIVLVPTGVREERFAVRGSHPSLLVVIDEGPHVIRRVGLRWRQAVGIRSSGTKGRATMSLKALR